MKQFLILLALCLVTMFGCEGNKHKNDALKNAVEKFKDTLVITEYIPREYAEVKTDTLLTNGFSVSIKTYTNMNRFITHTYKIDNTLSQIDHYRDWISEVQIKKNNVLIFNKILDANFFLNEDKTINDSLKNAINNKVWLNDEFPLKKNEITLIGGFIFPKSKNTLYFNIRIDDKGNYRVTKIEI